MSLRYRIEWSRGRQVAFISHLDLVRTMERGARRAGLPLSMTQGFNPRPRMVFASPLPVGVLAQAEILDLWLEEEIGDLTSALGAELPPGLELSRSRPVRPDSPQVMSVVDAALYRVSFLNGSGRDSGQEPDRDGGRDRLIQAVMEKKELIITRQRHRKDPRQIDVRPLILALAYEGQGVFEALVRTGSRGNLRPGELVELLRREDGPLRLPEKTLICRRALGHWTGEELVPAWDL